MNQQALSALIWSVADLLRGDFKQSEYGRVILGTPVILESPARPLTNFLSVGSAPNSTEAQYAFIRNRE